MHKSEDLKNMLNSHLPETFRDELEELLSDCRGIQSVQNFIFVSKTQQQRNVCFTLIDCLILFLLQLKARSDNTGFRQHGGSAHAMVQKEYSEQACHVADYAPFLRQWDEYQMHKINRQGRKILESMGDAHECKHLSGRCKTHSTTWLTASFVCQM
jgi:hypothetical protein